MHESLCFLEESSMRMHSSAPIPQSADCHWYILKLHRCRASATGGTLHNPSFLCPSKHWSWWFGNDIPCIYGTTIILSCIRRPSGGILQSCRLQFSMLRTALVATKIGTSMIPGSFKKLKNSHTSRVLMEHTVELLLFWQAQWSCTRVRFPHNMTANTHKLFPHSIAAKWAKAFIA